MAALTQSATRSSLELVVKMATFASFNILLLFNLVLKASLTPGTSIHLSARYVLVKNLESMANRTVASGIVSRCSFGQCADICNRLHSQCPGFIFQSDDANKIITTGTGNCQPLAFAVVGDAAVDLSVNDHHVYIAGEYIDEQFQCTHNKIQLKTVSADLGK